MFNGLMSIFIYNKRWVYSGKTPALDRDYVFPGKVCQKKSQISNCFMVRFVRRSHKFNFAEPLDLH